MRSPIGSVAFAADERELHAATFGEDSRAARARLMREVDGELRYGDPLRVGARLDAYFGGQLSAIDDIPVRLTGTAFQNAVWTLLRGVSAGTTTTYGELAQRLGAPSASRAVGSANGANPIVLIVPCHRVIGARGALTGYGSGIERKAWLLRHEGVELPLAHAPSLPGQGWV